MNRHVKSQTAVGSIRPNGITTSVVAIVKIPLNVLVPTGAIVCKAKIKAGMVIAASPPLPILGVLQLTHATALLVSNLNRRVIVSANKSIKLLLSILKKKIMTSLLI